AALARGGLFARALIARWSAVGGAACRRRRWVDGHQTELDALLADAGQFVEGRLADERDELRLVRDVHRLAADVRLRRGRAVPVQIVAALAPRPAIEFGDGRAQDARAVRPVHPLLLTAHR